MNIFKPNFYLKRRFDEKKQMKIKNKKASVPSISSADKKILSAFSTNLDIDEPSEDISSDIKSDSK